MKEKNRTILMCMYARTVGGAELQFVELANYLSQRNQVRLLCLGGYGALQGFDLSPSIDLKVYPYIPGSKWGVLSALAKAWWENFFHSYDACISTGITTNQLAWLICVGRKHVRLVSMQTVSDFLRRRTLNRMVLRRFDILIAGANDIRDYLVNEEQKPERIRVVHNWVDFCRRIPVATRSEMRLRLGVSPESLVVGCIGRLHPQKGQLYLLRAFPAILKNVPNAFLLLVGDGDERESLKREAVLLGVSGRVAFPGILAGQDYVDAINSIDIYVQPSVFEGLPRTLLDAMYLEKPIVATEVNGNREAIVDGVNGLLVEEKNIDSLALAICRLIHDRALQARLARCAHESAVELFDMEKQLARIESLVVA